MPTCVVVMEQEPNDPMSSNDESQDEGNSAGRSVLGVLAICAFVAAILCLVLFVVVA